ncbi:MAG: UDP-3-O-(3-hydroxymyristoyl)glucosamine N-acyltransferase [Gammaproteobacteria bacterium]|nr:UDP-3-O-(3-hydroxymyristoyl)glucosamine N-acyltransferase [Gammaproteobacteria bacterium]
MTSNPHKSQFQLSELIQGLDAILKGDPNCLITSVSTIQQAEPGQITFLMNPQYKKYLPETQASAVILTQEDSEDCPVNAIICRDPYYIYAKIAARFEQKITTTIGVHPSAVVGKDCEIDPTVSIAANAVIGDRVKLGPHVIIGPNCVIGDAVEIDEHASLDANVTLYFRVKVGKRVHISSGAVIGSDGFGFAKHKGSWQKVPQLGRVILEDDVDIGANTAIDRGAINDTVIEKGAKLDNLIQIGHNVRIGENTAIAGCVGIAGSSVIGKNCLIGGQAGVGGHLTIADNVMITGGTEVTKSIREPGIYSSGVGGLVTNKEWRKNSARLHRLEHLTNRVKELEIALEALTERIAT